MPVHPLKESLDTKRFHVGQSRKDERDYRVPRLVEDSIDEAPTNSAMKFLARISTLEVRFRDFNLHMTAVFHKWRCS